MRLDEKTRQELLDKSKNADVTKSYGTTRYDRRNHVHVYNVTGPMNRLDMNRLFKSGIISLILPVRGETDNYEVEILFEGIMSEIQEQVKIAKKVEFKCIYRALINAINKSNVYIGCSCADFAYTHHYQATKGIYNSQKAQLIPADVRNPNDTKGAGCKHVLNVLANLDWVLKLATCINNYCTYMSENMIDKYRDIMFPALYGMSWVDAVDKGLVQDDEPLDVDDGLVDSEGEINGNM